MVSGGSETSELTTMFVRGVVQRSLHLDTIMVGKGTETYCTNDAAYICIYVYGECRVCGLAMHYLVVCFV